MSVRTQFKRFFKPQYLSFIGIGLLVVCIGLSFLGLPTFAEQAGQLGIILVVLATFTDR